MHKHALLFDKWALPQARRGFEALLWILAIYAVPIAIGLVSLLALVFWDDQYVNEPGMPVPVQVLAAASPDTPLPEIRALVAARPHQPHYDTRLSEAPVWFVARNPRAEDGRAVLEFPSRHAVDVACWDHATLAPLGEASRRQVIGAMEALKGGFALTLAGPRDAVMCRASFVGPARLTVVVWDAQALSRSVVEFHRKSGLLDGGLIVLAVFVLVTALINRQSLYVLFAAWLVVSLRMGAISAGWDIQWLGRSVPADWLVQGRSVTVAIYGLLTLTLYRTLFQEELSRSIWNRPIRYVQWLCLPFLIVSFFLGYRLWVSMTWLVTGTGLVLMTCSLGSILWYTRSRVAMWYGASLGVTFVSGLLEIIAAASGMKELVGTANFVTVALSSSLLAALAIAEQMRQEHVQRLQVQAELEHNFNAMPIGLFTLDLQGRFLSANPALLDMLGPRVLMTGTNVWQRYFDQGAWTQLHHRVYNHTSGELEIGGARSRNGSEPRRYLVKATLANARIEGSLQDVTEKSRVAEDLNFLAHNDPLTKVLNRRGVENAYIQATYGGAAASPMALAYLDLDRFKLINDLYGHNVGDEVLLQVCRRVMDVVSGGIRVGRVGGDEFVIMLPDTKMPLATLVCQGIVRSIGGAPFQVGEKAFHVRGSIGLIEVNSGTLLKDAISTADRACREAKRGHHDGLVVYERNAVALHEHEAELRLVEQLSAHSATDGLHLVMQPIMSLKAPYESLNFEVLLRMRDSAGNAVPTERLISAAENSGRMSVIDRWVLSTTLEWLKIHQRRMPNTRFVCLNLSGASLNDERFMEDVFSMLAANTEIARLLCIEITESVALHDLNNTRTFIDTVRSYGATVALDDFGAGYTSFSYLKQLPADLLKIDGSFIVNMNEHPANVAIVEAIVNLARNLGMRTIAEWAENTATVRTLADIGVDFVQGFVVAHPQEPEALLLAESSAAFIRDEALLRLTHRLGAAGDHILSQVELFDRGNPQSVRGSVI